MRLFELTDTSDPYTFYAPSLEVAAVAVYAIGSGAFGARDVENHEAVPPCVFWGDWLRSRGISADFYRDHASQIADALDSFLIGDATTRRDIEELLAEVSPEKRAEWRRKRQDERRSSLNRIGESAARVADKYRQQFAITGATP